MGAYEKSDGVEEESLTLCPFSSSKNTTSICWTCSMLCCCLPICYPCYLTHTLRERSKKKKLVISRKLCQANYGHKSDKKRVTPTMKSEQSTGASGYETLLSRKGTLVSLQPNLDKSRIHQAVVNTLETNYRTNISAIFVATDAAHSFLNFCQTSELLQNCPMQNKSRAEKSEFTNSIICSEEHNHEETLSRLSNNSSYSFSQLYLHLNNDLLNDLEKGSKMNKCEVLKNGNHEGTTVKEFDKEGLFRDSGYVDVSEQSTATRVCVTLEVSRENIQNLDPVQLANAYCRQLLAKSNVVVLMMSEKDRDRVKFLRKGLLGYVSKYWAGYFSVLYVEIDRRVKVTDEDNMLLGSLERIFGCVETLSVKDDSKLAGSVFSALARMGIVMKSCNNVKIA